MLFLGNKDQIAFLASLHSDRTDEPLGHVVRPTPHE
jgi:hypothetical protein